MRKVSTDPNLIRGRFPDLADEMNPLTFSLFEKIFGFQGPFRSILNQFHIGDPSNAHSYIRYHDGIIYSDLSIENRVLWQPTGFKAISGKGTIRITLSLFNHFFPNNVYRLLKKIRSDFAIVTNPTHYLQLCFESYQHTANCLTTSKSTNICELSDFLSCYQDVVFVAYINEIFANYIKPDKNLIFQPEINAYLQKYDALLKPFNMYFEQPFIKNGFALGQTESTFSSSDLLIPSIFPALDIKQKDVGYLYTIQCLRNNLRLKTNALLHYLNNYLYVLSGHNPNFRNYSIDEIQTGIVTSPKHPIKQRTRKITQTNLKKTTHNLVITGTPCSAGKAQGKIQIITNPNQEVSGDILVFPNASPMFTQQFLKGKGLVFAIGSPLSHGAIVAREMGIPAIVASFECKDNDLLTGEINGTSGELKIY